MKVSEHNYLLGHLEAALGLHVLRRGSPGTFEGGAQSLHGRRGGQLCRSSRGPAPPPAPLATLNNTDTKSNIIEYMEHFIIIQF